MLREKIYDALGETTLEKMMLAQPHVAITPCIRRTWQPCRKDA